jgi:hypothetical protein
MDDHTEDLVAELTFREWEDFLLLGWKDKLNVLKNHEWLRDPTGDKRFFFSQSEAPFVTTKLQIATERHLNALVLLLLLPLLMVSRMNKRIRRPKNSYLHV